MPGGRHSRGRGGAAPSVSEPVLRSPTASIFQKIIDFFDTLVVCSDRGSRRPVKSLPSESVHISESVLSSNASVFKQRFLIS